MLAEEIWPSNDAEEIWDGSVAIIVFEDDGTKHLVCQSGIRMSAETQLKLADDLKRNALKNYDKVEDIRKSQRQELIAEWSARLNEPKEIKTQCVYIMKAGNSYKVGISKNPKDRLRDVSRHQPNAELVACSKQIHSKEASRIEKKIHEVLKKRNITGEWFLLRPHEANIVASWIQEIE